MFEPLRKMFSGKKGKERARLPAGERAYVIGDIHGRADLFAALVEAIEADAEQAGSIKSTIILLGDLIDRGPDSAGVVRMARELMARRAVRCLIGNHEEMLLDSFGDKKILRHFLRHGGRETILSYGVSKKDFNAATLEELQALMRSHIPDEDIAFLEGCEDMIEMGDYLFVHAGINPKRPFDEQKTHELRWIRDPFLKHKDRYSHIVVHGHTITEDVEEKKNRIGIDTGAYRFGRLTALVLEADTRRYIQSVEKKSGDIKIVTREDAA